MGMVRPFNVAWSLLKSRTLRNQEGWPAMQGHEPASGAAHQPFTNVNVRQRVPLVGAQRVDEDWAERSDSAQPLRGKERGAMLRNIAADKPPTIPFDEEEGVDESSDLNDFRNQQALEEMLNNIRTREIKNPQGHSIPPTPSPEQLRSTAQRPPPKRTLTMDPEDIYLE